MNGRKKQDATAEFPEFMAIFKPRIIPQPDGKYLVDPGKPIMVTGDDTISVGEFAQMKGISIREVQRLCYERIIRAERKTHRDGSHYRIFRSEIERFDKLRNES